MITSSTDMPSSSAEHLKRVRNHFDNLAPLRGPALAYRGMLAHYYNLIIPATASVLEIGCGAGDLLCELKAREVAGVDISEPQLVAARRKLPEALFLCQSGETLDLGDRKFDYIIISDTLNYSADVQKLLARALAHAKSDTRLVINCHNTLWRPFMALATFLGLRTRGPENSWLSRADVASLANLAGWDVIKMQTRILLPLPLGFISGLINRWLAPLFPWFCFSLFIMARPKPAAKAAAPSVSVVIPARNEAGNIEAAILRTPEMGAWTEIIFVEGNSTDNTWAEIQRLEALYKGRRRIKILQQSGKGKGNAVRDGYAVAEGDILMILDADLTMPPEELPKFYHALTSGTCDFANGSRLVYPMEDKAMQFLNLCANKVFGIIFSWLLDQQVKDTLCGTKVLTKAHYLNIAAHRSYFGDFDPFGDFDLLFGADKQNLKIVDIPIRYKERTYGSTNIQRWSHGVLLLRMVLFAARKLKFV
jgi:SAM-dependent methyltransferase